jgi:hypothetical protein
LSQTETSRLEQEKAIRLKYTAFDLFRQKHKPQTPEEQATKAKMAEDNGGNDMDNDKDFADTSKDEGLDADQGLEEQTVAEEAAKPVDLSSQETAAILDPKSADELSLEDRIKEFTQTRNLNYFLPTGTPIVDGGETKPLVAPLEVQLKQQLVLVRGKFKNPETGAESELPTKVIAKSLINKMNATGVNPFVSSSQVLSADLAVPEFPCYKVCASPGIAMSRFLSMVTVVGSAPDTAKNNSTLLGGIVLIPGESANGDPAALELGKGPGLAELPVEITSLKNIGSLAVVAVRVGASWVLKMAVVRAAIVTADDLLKQYELLRSSADPAIATIITGFEELLKTLRVFRYDLLSNTERALYSKYLTGTEAGKTVLEKVVFRAADFGNAMPVHFRMESTLVGKGVFIIDIVVPRAPIVPHEVLQGWAVKGRVEPGKTRCKTPRTFYDDQPAIQKLFATLYTPTAAVAAATPTTPAEVKAAPVVAPTSPVPAKRTKQTAPARAPAAATAAPPQAKAEPEKTPAPVVNSDEAMMAVDAATEETTGKIVIAVPAPVEVVPAAAAAVAPTPAAAARKRANSKVSQVAVAADAQVVEPPAKKGKSAKAAAAAAAAAPTPPTAVAPLVMPEGPPKTLQGHLFGMLERASKYYSTVGKGKDKMFGVHQTTPLVGPFIDSKESRDSASTSAQFLNVFGPIATAKVLQALAQETAVAEIAARPPVDDAKDDGAEDSW